MPRDDSVSPASGHPSSRPSSRPTSASATGRPSRIPVPSRRNTSPDKAISRRNTSPDKAISRRTTSPDKVVVTAFGSGQATRRIMNDEINTHAWIGIERREKGNKNQMPNNAELPAEAKNMTKLKSQVEQLKTQLEERDQGILDLQGLLDVVTMALEEKKSELSNYKTEVAVLMQQQENRILELEAETHAMKEGRQQSKAVQHMKLKDCHDTIQQLQLQLNSQSPQSSPRPSETQAEAEATARRGGSPTREKRMAALRADLSPSPSTRIEQLQTALKEAKHSGAASHSELVEVKEEVEALQHAITTEVVALTSQKELSEDESRAIAAALEALRHKLAASEAQVAQSQQSLEAASLKQQSLEEDVSRGAKQIAELTAALEAVNDGSSTKLAEAESALEDVDSAGIELRSLQDDLANKSREADKSREDELVNLRAELGVAVAANKQLASQKQSYEEAMNSAHALFAAHSELVHSAPTKSKSDELHRTIGEITEMKTAILNFMSKEAAMEVKITDLEAKLAHAEHELQERRSQEASAVPLAETVPATARALEALVHQVAAADTKRVELEQQIHTHRGQDANMVELEHQVRALRVEDAAKATQLTALKEGLATAKKRNAEITSESHAKIASMHQELKNATAKAAEQAAVHHCLTAEIQAITMMQSTRAAQVAQLESALASSQKQADLLARGSNAVHQSQLSALQNEVRAAEQKVEDLTLQNQSESVTEASRAAGSDSENGPESPRQVIAALELSLCRVEAEKEQMEIDHARALMVAFNELKATKISYNDRASQHASTWLRDVSAAEEKLSSGELTIQNGPSTSHVDQIADNSQKQTEASAEGHSGLQLRDILHTSQASQALQGIMKRALSPTRSMDNRVPPSQYVGPSRHQIEHGFAVADHYAHRLNELQHSRLPRARSPPWIPPRIASSHSHVASAQYVPRSEQAFD